MAHLVQRVEEALLLQRDGLNGQPKGCPTYEILSCPP